MLRSHRLFIGFDRAQARAYHVAWRSAMATTRHPLIVEPLALEDVQRAGLYTRPTRDVPPGYWDELSAAPMSTGHAIARFLVPALCGYKGWALFTDGDVLFRRDVADLFALADPSKAVQVVQHAYAPTDTTKMAGQPQTRYDRKNWSSVLLFNCAHPANQVLTVELVNTVPGRDLHRFCWLEDSLIGALPPVWNHLVGHSSSDEDPAIVHFTEGCPDLPGYESCAFADEWRAYASPAFPTEVHVGLGG